MIDVVDPQGVGLGRMIADHGVKLWIRVTWIVAQSLNGRIVIELRADFGLSSTLRTDFHG